MVRGISEPVTTTYRGHHAGMHKFLRRVQGGFTAINTRPPKVCTGGPSVREGLCKPVRAAARRCYAAGLVAYQGAAASARHAEA